VSDQEAREGEPQDELDRLCARLASVDAALDDVALARGEARLRSALTAPMARPRSLAVTARAIGAMVAVIAIAATAALLAGNRRAAPTSRAAMPVLLPYLVTSLEGGASSTPPALSDGDHLDVPSGWLVRASVGDGIAIGVTGPARVSVDGSVQAPRLRLDGGRLLADVTPGRGTHLRVSTLAMDVDVVGTLFSVDASGVDVRSGRVSVRARADGAAIEVDAGYRVGPSARTLEPIDPRAAAALQAQQAAPAPTPGAIFVTIAGEPPGAEIRTRDRLLAVTPARLRLVPGTALSLTAPGRVPAVVVVPATPTTIAYSLAPPSSPPPTQSPPIREHRGVAKAGKGSPPASSSPSPAESPRAPARPSPRALYRDADRALAAGDNDAARAALLAIVDDGSDPTLADAARLDLATLALRAGELAASRRYLDGLTGAAVAEPAAHLRCRIAGADAADCLAAFRRTFPTSPHAAEALIEEAILRTDHGDCARARPLLTSAAAGPLSPANRAAVQSRLALCSSEPNRPSERAGQSR
jgi:hypothetical protein